MSTEQRIQKSDISDREDVELLVNAFYEKVLDDSLLAPIFTEVVEVDWDAHLPVMYDFWSGILLGPSDYRGNPMRKHVLLSEKTDMGEREFARWLDLFNATVDAHFSGNKTEEAKVRAGNIAQLMLHKIRAKGEQPYTNK